MMGRMQVSSGMLLVATTALQDPHFADTVVLLLDVSDEGALGVVLNRPSQILVADVLEPWRDVVDEPEVLFRGGPVGVDGAIAVGRLRAIDDPPVGWRPVAGLLGMIDLDTPTELVDGSLSGLRVFAGYSGWGAQTARGRDRGGQLVRRLRGGRRRVPRRHREPVARRDAPPAGHARLAREPARRS